MGVRRWTPQRHITAVTARAQAKAYRIADNQTATLSQWDYDRLPVELAELQQLDFDLNLIGFSADELLGLLEPPPPDGTGDPEDVPEPPDEPQTKRGDAWLLGRHRVLCGDSAEAADVDRLLAGAPVHLVHTDPPYNVGVEPRSHNAIAAGHSSTMTSTYKGSSSIRKARRPVCSAAMRVEPLPPKRSRTFSAGRDEYSRARTASSAGFSVRWTICCGLTFLIDHTSTALAGPKNWCAAPSRQP